MELLPGDVVKILARTDRLSVPCDLLVVQGSCAVDESILTGESVLQLKEDINSRDENESLDTKSSKIHILYGGTDIVSWTGAKGPNELRCYVLRTGWATTQGKLLRTILFSSERVTVGSKEALYFILILLCFAVAAAGYVVSNTMNDENRDPYKILLKCILIITSVVPPELPIELALAVNSAIVTLQTKQIYCTEPFRLPFAGKATICCFDKTGTLTDQDFTVKGVVISGAKDASKLHSLRENIDVATVLAGCHSLSQVNSEIMGDPIEKVALQTLGWRFSNEESYGQSGEKVTILKRFPFSSDLKRMSTIARVYIPGTSVQQLKLLTKGAPETIISMLNNPPENYMKLYQQMSADGLRVLALALRDLSTDETINLSVIKREELEQNLRFAGFLALNSPLKTDTKKVVEELMRSSHEVKMITGDSMYTASQVAMELNFGKAPVYCDTSTGMVRFLNHMGEEDQPKSDSYICATGDAIPVLLDTPHFNSVKVWARTSPAQKVRDR